jgi:hypothetical protein
MDAWSGKTPCPNYHPTRRLELLLIAQRLEDAHLHASAAETLQPLHASVSDTSLPIGA